MNIRTLASFPSEIICNITSSLDADSIGKLWFSGDILLLRRLSLEGGVRSLRLKRWNNFDPFSSRQWPSLLEHFPKLEEIYVDSCFGELMSCFDVKKMPKTMKRIEFHPQCLRSVTVDANTNWTRQFPMLEYLEVKGPAQYQISRTIISTLSQSTLTSLILTGACLGDDTINLLPRSLIELEIGTAMLKREEEWKFLPPNLTSFTLRSSSSTNMLPYLPSSLTSLALLLNDMDWTPETMLLLPRGLKRLKFRSSSPDSNLFNNLPPALTHLENSSPRSSWARPTIITSLPPQLEVVIGIKWKFPGIPEDSFTSKEVPFDSTLLSSDSILLLPPKMRQLDELLLLGHTPILHLPFTMTSLKLSLADIENGLFRTEFSFFKSIPHLLTLHVDTMPFEAIGLLPRGLTDLKWKENEEGKIWSNVEILLLPPSLLHLSLPDHYSTMEGLQRLSLIDLEIHDPNLFMSLFAGDDERELWTKQPFCRNIDFVPTTLITLDWQIGQVPIPEANWDGIFKVLSSLVLLEKFSLGCDYNTAKDPTPHLIFSYLPRSLQLIAIQCISEVNDTIMSSLPPNLNTLILILLPENDTTSYVSDKSVPFWPRSLTRLRLPIQGTLTSSASAGWPVLLASIDMKGARPLMPRTLPPAFLKQKPFKSSF
jgi:hypothetical protein